jgi:ABC-type nitrate/sulfonate/bicarbonate transport system permease component
MTKRGAGSEPWPRGAAMTKGVLGSGQRYVVGGVSVAGFLALWQVLVTGPMADKPFATVPQILVQLSEFAQDPGFWGSLGETTKVAVLGLLLAIVVGVLLGVVVGQSDAAYRSSRVVVEVLKPIPPIVVLPLLVLLLGPTSEMSVWLVFLGSVFVLITQTAHGVHDVDPVALETARSFRLTRLQRMRRLVLPTALPFVATGVRIGASAALVIAIVSEIIGGAPGLGKDLVLAQSSGDYPAIYALVAIFGMLGVLLNALLSKLERKVLFWHASVRTESAA